MDAEHLKYLKDEISEVLDYVISDILKIKYNEEPPDIKVGDIVRRIGSDPTLDTCDFGVVTYSNGPIIYVMRNDGSCCDEERIDWYKVGCINWLPDTIRHINDILEEY